MAVKLVERCCLHMFAYLEIFLYNIKNLEMQLGGKKFHTPCMKGLCIPHI